MANTDLGPVAFLEQEYAHRGLRFTSPFSGLEPIQAFGYLDGKRFYFRLRGTTASIAIGHYDRNVEEKNAQQLNDQLADALGFSPEFKPADEADPELCPSVVEYEDRTEARGRTLAELFRHLIQRFQPLS